MGNRGVTIEDVIAIAKKFSGGGGGGTGEVFSVNGKKGNVIITRTDIGLPNVDNTSDLNKPISTATQIALNSKVDTSSLSTVATSGNYEDLSNKPTIPTKTSELENNSDFVIDANYVHTDNNFTDDFVHEIELIDGNLIIHVNNTISTEVGVHGLRYFNGNLQYYDENLASWVTIASEGGVDSVNGKTGVVLIDKTDVGLGNVDNTSDLGKPISTLTQIALNNKADITSLPTRTSELINDSDFVVDASYVHTDNNFSNVYKAQVDTNTSNITLKASKNELFIETTARQDGDNDLQNQIDALAGQNEWLGLIETIPSGQEQSVLTQFVVDNYARQPRKGDQITIDDRNEIWLYSEHTNNSNLWERWLSTVISDADTISKGVVQIGSGINVTHGIISADKVSIGLPNVDNIQQYSAINPPPYPVSSVNGKMGAVTITKNDVGLSDVDNTADINKPASNPTKDYVNTAIQQAVLDSWGGVY